MPELTELTATQAAQGLRDGTFTSRELVQAFLERIERVDSRVQAFQCVMKEQALERAGEIDRARAAGEPLAPFAGVPIAVKDNMCLRGVPTTCSSKILESFEPPYDATVVDKLNAAGLVTVGKTNMDEFAMGSSTENSAFRVTGNPWDLDRIPGGSSGGSAAAVAAREVPWALGSDTGGSIRQPASFCSVLGMKPTYGRVSRYGLVAFASSLDQIGPMTRTAEDAAALLSIISGHDPRDSTSIDQPVPDYLAEMSTDDPKSAIKGLTLGVPKEYMPEGTDPAVRGMVDAAIQALEPLGVTVREISLPHTPYAIATYYMICTAEASSNLARYDGVVYGHRHQGADSLVEMYRLTRSEGFGAEVKRRIMLGTYVLSAGYYDAYYRRAQRVRTLLKQDFEKAFEEVDAVICPTTPTPAFRRDEKTGDPLQMYLSDVFTAPLNLAGLPGLSIPGGFSPEGLPLGLQFLGPAMSESLLLRVSHAFQTVTDHHTKVPDCC